jgi:hypothetical protein
MASAPRKHPTTRYKVQSAMRPQPYKASGGGGGHLINSERWPGQWSQLSSDQIWSEVPPYFRITAAAVERGIAGFGIGEVGLFLLYKQASKQASKQVSK